MTVQRQLGGAIDSFQTTAASLRLSAVADPQAGRHRNASNPPTLSRVFCEPIKPRRWEPGARCNRSLKATRGVGHVVNVQLVRGWPRTVRAKTLSKLIPGSPKFEFESAN